jgi:trans-2,3-dihydro-3-hydroxyanthranilate isomerase
MRCRFFTCDVFSDRRFGGNPLAVLPDARGLDPVQMQQIAREFGFSETTFVLAPERGGTRRVRIFTPHREIPFAGHPNLGTAFVLAVSGELGPLGDRLTVRFEELAGIVTVEVATTPGGALRMELEAPQPAQLGEATSPDALAQVLALAPGNIATAVHAPRLASVGLPFLIAQLPDLDALARARVDLAALERVVAQGLHPDLYLYVRTGKDALRARMFAPLSGVAEDPATGSAACALAALLASLQPERSGSFRYRIAQGIEMERPSALEARAEKRDGAIVSTHVAGSAVLISEGTLELD